MTDPKKTAEQLQESLNELFHDDPWFNRYLDPIIAALDERERLREACVWASKELCRICESENKYISGLANVRYRLNIAPTPPEPRQCPPLSGQRGEANVKQIHSQRDICSHRWQN